MLEYAYFGFWGIFRRVFGFALFFFWIILVRGVFVDVTCGFDSCLMRRDKRVLFFARFVILVVFG